MRKRNPVAASTGNSGQMMARDAASGRSGRPKSEERRVAIRDAATTHAIAESLARLVDYGLLKPHATYHASWQLANMAFGSFHVRLLFGLIQHGREEELDAYLRHAVEDFLMIYRRA